VNNSSGRLCWAGEWWGRGGGERRNNSYGRGLYGSHGERANKVRRA